MTASLTELQAYVGQSIGDICSNGFASNTQNHCAHFVSHAHNINLGLLCGDMAFKTKRTGASIRCDEIYNRLTLKGKWEDRPTISDGQHKVVVDPSVDAFHHNFKHQYAGGDIALYYGVAP